MGYELSDSPIKAKIVAVDEKNRVAKEFAY
jgi:hypothetical protein